MMKSKYDNIKYTKYWDIFNIALDLPPFLYRRFYSIYKRIDPVVAYVDNEPLRFNDIIK